MRILITAACTLLLCACRPADYAAADGRIVFDKDGCAFLVKKNIGATSFVIRLRDADKETCKKSPPSERGA